MKHLTLVFLLALAPLSWGWDRVFSCTEDNYIGLDLNGESISYRPAVGPEADQFASAFKRKGKIEVRQHDLLVRWDLEGDHLLSVYKNEPGARIAFLKGEGAKWDCQGTCSSSEGSISRPAFRAFAQASIVKSLTIMPDGRYFHAYYGGGAETRTGFCDEIQLLLPSAGESMKITQDAAFARMKVEELVMMEQNAKVARQEVEQQAKFNRLNDVLPVVAGVAERFNDCGYSDVAKKNVFAHIDRALTCAKEDKKITSEQANAVEEKIAKYRKIGSLKKADCEKTISDALRHLDLVGCDRIESANRH